LNLKRRKESKKRENKFLAGFKEHFSSVGNKKRIHMQFNGKHLST
jgi:hypothetical protein